MGQELGNGKDKHWRLAKTTSSADLRQLTYISLKNKARFVALCGKILHPPPPPNVCQVILCYCQYMPTMLYLLWLLILVHQHLNWLPRDQWYRKYMIDKESVKFWTLTVILTSNKKIKCLQKTFHPMMIYHPIKFDCKKINNSVHMVETVIFILWAITVTLMLKIAKPISLHDTLAIDDASL